MITLRRGDERHHQRGPTQAAWLTFRVQDAGDPLASGFGALEQLTEYRLGPGTSLPLRAAHDLELVTYVLSGALTRKDRSGRSGLLQSGEFQRVSGARASRSREQNSTDGDAAHVFQLTLGPDNPPLSRSLEQQRFSAADRRGRLRLIAAPDARDGSLQLHRDALVFSALLTPGQHIVHPLAVGRGAWLHVVAGEIAFGELLLAASDAVGITSERAVSFTAVAPAEVMLLDLATPTPSHSRTSNPPHRR
jgi:redox-sensitive bicupin YhaK (pirin superfamily)